jgi:hypothetical protein
MVHPGAASIECTDCAKYVYNLQTGEREMYDAGDELLPILRGDNPTPCSSCPKGSPENGEKLKLHWRNRRALDFYQRMKASSRAAMPKHLRDCHVTQRNFFLIDQVLKTARAEIRANAIEDARKERRSE